MATRTYLTQRMSKLYKTIYSGAERGVVVVAPSQSLIICSQKKYFFLDDALSARPYRWPIKRFRDIIHVGLNTLSRVYKGSETTLSIKESMWFISRFDSLTTTKTIDMKKNIILTAKIIPVVLIMWVITSILQTHG